MSRGTFPVSIDSVVDLLHLEVDPHTAPGSVSWNVRCPFCDRPGKYHMNINSAKDIYRCVRCSGDQKNLGVLDLYGRVRFGTPLGRDNSGELYRKLLKELNREGEIRPAFRPQAAAVQETLPVSDDSLDRVYSALLDLPYLGLREEHLENLHVRGFDDETINRNRYASFCADWIQNHPKYVKASELYETRKIAEEKKKFRVSRDSRETMIAGMLIACDLQKKGCRLNRIPGFYRLNGLWFLRMVNGMAIPTRNARGQIVGIQVRTARRAGEGSRYLTVSSKDLPEGPDVKISRIHFPLGNGELSASARVILTEGPLKADAAVMLYPKPVCFFAIQGVSNTRELPEVLKYLKNRGVETVYDGLDMDRIINWNVAKADGSIAGICRKQNIRYRSVFWDRAYAEETEQLLEEICRCCGVDYLAGQASVEWRVRENMMNLHRLGYRLDEEMEKLTGKPMEAWRKNTKGIDDFLLLHRQNSKES